MARIVKNPEVRRNEIIDVAQKLFLTKGYDDTSVQDILDGAGIAKGTFYHYFDSKMALLDSLINRLIDSTLQSIEPIIYDEEKTAPQKMDQYFDTIMQWKTARREFFMDFARVLYRDNNAIYRYKLISLSLRRVAPFFAAIVEQGIDEGVFHTHYPTEVAEIIYAVLRSLSESMTIVLLDREYQGDMEAAFERIINAHEESIARILGYDGKLELIDLDVAKLWLEVAESRKT